MRETLKIRLPENLADITLEQAQKLDILNAKRDSLDELSFVKRYISIFTELKFRDLDNISMSDFDGIHTQITEALDTEVPFENRFVLNQVEYGFVPNLNEITTGEYIDLSTYGNSMETLHKTMAVLFRPITKDVAFGSYEIEPYNGTKDRAEVMKQAPMNIVIGMLVFFCDLSKELKSHILKSTLVMEEQKKTQ
jgi:hypothetical protein